jgi:hypothetical protein
MAARASESRPGLVRATTAAACAATTGASRAACGHGDVGGTAGADLLARRRQGQEPGAGADAHRALEAGQVTGEAVLVMH